MFFFHTKKVGLALGLKWGAGVLLAHILDEAGHESWSAPVLFKVHEVSLGLLAGAMTLLQCEVCRPLCQVKLCTQG